MQSSSGKEKIKASFNKAMRADIDGKRKEKKAHKEFRKARKQRHTLEN